MKNQNFVMSSGDDLDLVVTVRESDGCELVDLTHATAVWVLAEERGRDPLLTRIAVLSDAAAGEITVSLVPADTADLCGGYYHELQVRDALGKTCTVMSGRARILGDSAP